MESVNLFTRKETDPEEEAEYLAMMLMRKLDDEELNKYTILKACERIYELGGDKMTDYHKEYQHSIKLVNEIHEEKAKLAQEIKDKEEAYEELQRLARMEREQFRNRLSDYKELERRNMMLLRQNEKLSKHCDTLLQSLARELSKDAVQ